MSVLIPLDRAGVQTMGMIMDSGLQGMGTTMQDVAELQETGI